MSKHHIHSIITVTFISCCMFSSCNKQLEIINIPATYENLSNDTLQSGMACIAADGMDNLYVVWKGARWTGPYGPDSGDIFFSMKQSGGTWTEPIEISGHKQICTAPSMVADQAGNVYVVWLEYYGFYKIFYRKRNANDWEPTQTIVEDIEDHAELPYLTIDYNNGLHLTWCGLNSIKYKYKPFNQDWQDVVSIPCSYAPAGNPIRTVADNDNNIHAVYQDYRDFADIWYLLKSANGGWGDIINLSDNPQVQCWNARIVIDNQGIVHVTWLGSSEEQQNIYYTKNPGDNTWSTPSCIVDRYGYGQLCADDSYTLNLFFVARDSVTGVTDIFYGSKPHDDDWTGFVNITNLPGASGMGLCRNIVVDSHGDFHLVWEEDMGGVDNWDILYKKVERRP